MQGQCQLAAAPVSCLVDGQDANPSTTKQPEPQTPVNYMTDSPQTTRDVDRFKTSNASPPRPQSVSARSLYAGRRVGNDCENCPGNQGRRRTELTGPCQRLRTRPATVGTNGTWRARVLEP